MSWLSTVILGGFGFSIGGPIGAGIGVLIGSAFGKSRPADKTQQNQAIFFVSMFSMLAKMAKSDGQIVQQEIQVVTDFIDSIKLDTQDKQTAIQIFRNAVDDKYSIYDYATQYQEIATPEMRETLYSILYQIAYADGALDEAEDEILRNIPSYLGINPNIYSAFQEYSNPNHTTTFAKDLALYYQTLGCHHDDTDADVKKTYRQAMKEYHPDKIQSKGLNKSFLIFANEQTKRINKAYDAIKQERGMK